MGGRTRAHANAAATIVRRAAPPRDAHSVDAHSQRRSVRRNDAEEGKEGGREGAVEREHGGGDGNSVFFQACMEWAGTDTPKQTGCTIYKEGFFYSSMFKWGCCNLADCNDACVRHIVMCCTRCRANER